MIGPGRGLYGATTSAGDARHKGGGTVFSLTSPAVAGAPDGATILYPFGVAEGAGYQTETPLVLGPSGVLSGTSTWFLVGAGTILRLPRSRLRPEGLGL